MFCISSIQKSTRQRTPARVERPPSLSACATASSYTLAGHVARELQIALAKLMPLVKVPVSSTSVMWRSKMRSLRARSRMSSRTTSCAMGTPSFVIAKAMALSPQSPQPPRSTMPRPERTSMSRRPKKAGSSLPLLVSSSKRPAGMGKFVVEKTAEVSGESVLYPPRTCVLPPRPPLP